MARFSSQKSIRTFHFQKVPFAVGFLKTSFYSEKINFSFFDMLVSLKKTVLLENAYYLYNHISVKIFLRQKVHLFVLWVWARGDKKPEVQAIRVRTRQVSFFIVIGQS